MDLLGLVQPAVSDLEVAGRLAAAVGLGGLIGAERELAHQDAGLRTHIAVALGAALFGVISVHGFDAYIQPRADSNYQVDLTRVASQVVVGIGFLGGGAILKHGASVRGLTTAASLWVTAAVGLSAGVGSLVAATIATAALLLSLLGLRAPRDLILRKFSRARGTLVVTLREGSNPAGVLHDLMVLDDLKLQDLSVDNRREGAVVQADLVGPPGTDLNTVIEALAIRDDVAEVNLG